MLLLMLQFLLLLFLLQMQRLQTLPCLFLSLLSVVSVNVAVDVDVSGIVAMDAAAIYVPDSAPYKSGMSPARRDPLALVGSRIFPRREQLRARPRLSCDWPAHAVLQ